MKIVSVNVGRPVEVEWMGSMVRTSIFKSAVTGKRQVSYLNIDGDEQSDLKVHGGVNKAVYSYDVSYYDHWKTILDRDLWEYGLFGENLTTIGMQDDQVRVGDVYRAGTVELQVIQPRFPCIKINVRFGRPDMMEIFMQQRRNGIYFRVVREGEVEAGDELRLVENSPYSVTIQDYVECYYSKGRDRQVLHALLSIPFLPERHRTVFGSFLER